MFPSRLTHFTSDDVDNENCRHQPFPIKTNAFGIIRQNGKRCYSTFTLIKNKCSEYEQSTSIEINTLTYMDESIRVMNCIGT